jgi:phage recombination protein Bet
MTENLPTQLNWQDNKLVSVIKNTVAKGTTEPEFEMFKQMCISTGLNPFKKEIWCIVTGSGDYRKVQMMTGVNGFYTIANDQPEFDGIESEEGPQQELKVMAQGAECVVIAPSSVTVRVYRKDRKIPFSFTAKWAEYAQDLVSKNGKLTIWAKMPSVMLSKCAESMALRKAFPQKMNGLYTQEEMPNSYAAPTIENVAEVASSQPEAEQGEYVTRILSEDEAKICCPNWNKFKEQYKAEGYRCYKNNEGKWEISQRVPVELMNITEGGE